MGYRVHTTTKLMNFMALMNMFRNIRSSVDNSRWKTSKEMYTASSKR